MHIQHPDQRLYILRNGAARTLISRSELSSEERLCPVHITGCKYRDIEIQYGVVWSGTQTSKAGKRGKER
ncbi:Uncharacterized protein HZ326_22941 [Fusarium oxysporum f. sp. albedinis]|nr:Uncharacterized protein HZ326_22941 [Fusarium oxysporum f. sp. albedinis]